MNKLIAYISIAIVISSCVSKEEEAPGSELVKETPISKPNPISETQDPKEEPIEPTPVPDPVPTPEPTPTPAPAPEADFVVTDIMTGKELDERVFVDFLARALQTSQCIIRQESFQKELRALSPAIFEKSYYSFRYEQGQEALRILQDYGVSDLARKVQDTLKKECAQEHILPKHYVVMFMDVLELSLFQATSSNTLEIVKKTNNRVLDRAYQMYEKGNYKAAYNQLQHKNFAQDLIEAN